MAALNAANANHVMKNPTLMIFGASGDLTARKLIPALFSLARNGFLPEKMPIIGVARRQKTNEQFREELKEVLTRELPAEEMQGWESFAERLYYIPTDFSQADDYRNLKT
ncbi:MAG TPA: glucose-6-phosphate dehydrogenase, partial [Planctomicrobium sp.]|nr:glucose-6-phosphate dehydrogenase [Planctomicrobium sp.]